MAQRECVPAWTSRNLKPEQFVLAPEKKTSTRPQDAMQADEAALGRGVRGEQGDARPANSAPRGEPHLNLQ